MRHNIRGFSVKIHEYCRKTLHRRILNGVHTTTVRFHLCVHLIYFSNGLAYSVYVIKFS